MPRHPNAVIVPNPRLREARLRAPSPVRAGQSMSRAELADAVNNALDQLYPGRDLTAHYVDARWIGKLERGEHRWPSDERRAALRHALGAATDTELGLYIPRHTEGLVGGGTTPRTPGSGVSGSMSLRPAGEMLDDDPRVSEVLTGEIARLESGEYDDWNSFSVITSMLAQQRQAVAPAALLSLVEAHRDCLLTLFRKAEGDPAAAAIGAMVGEASIVASRLWSAQGNRSTALARCAYARTLAERLGNIRLGATARIFESNLHSGASTLIHADGNIMTGLRLLDEAAAAAEHLSCAAQARIAAEQAQTYAALNMRSETEAALDRARQAAGGITSSNRTGLFSDWNPSRLDVYEGTCRILLREPEAAILHLERASAVLDHDPENANVALAAHVDLASAHALTGHLDMACTTLGDAYERLVRIGNLRGISRARRAREGLSRWNAERAVQELDERMAAV
ncbi:helix-turn-helix domain-containing protein [Dactylosporangium sp. CA-139114]|uniref:helix-turn-helix domain-containing protein n=1 Tax=Dactylosporangium sp. CA-139114 TaxID=3239931 RepID=UPI003D97663C